MEHDKWHRNCNPTVMAVIRAHSANKMTCSRQASPKATGSHSGARRRDRPAPFAVAVLALPALAATAPPHPHEDILAAVEAAALSDATARGLDELEVRVRPLDRRLRPAQCGEALHIIRPHNARVLGPLSYGVRCAAPTPWTLYLRADVSAALQVPVLRAPLPRGALIAQGDLELITRRITGPVTDLILDPGRAIGRQLKRALAAGAALRYGHVALPRLISRGQTVTLLAGTDGLEVRMRGKAMGNAAAGERLQVTNISSGRRVEGVVLADGSVRIP